MAIALIHNNEPGRVAKLRTTFSDVAGQLGTELFEVSEQPPLVPLTFAESWSISTRFFACARRWASYPTGRPRGWRPGETRAAFDEARQAETRRRQAAMICISAKHVAAWRKSAAARDPYLIVLESDAIGKADSVMRLQTILEGFPADEAVFVDLGGGFAPNDLGLQSLVTEQLPGGLARLSRFATNTACGYLLSRAAVATFLDVHDSVPAVRGFGPDWLMNAIALELVQRGGGLPTCYHSQPPVLEHGSKSGAFRSELR